MKANFPTYTDHKTTHIRLPSQFEWTKQTQLEGHWQLTNSLKWEGGWVISSIIPPPHQIWLDGITKKVNNRYTTPTWNALALDKRFDNGWGRGGSHSLHKFFLHIRPDLKTTKKLKTYTAGSLEGHWQSTVGFIKGEGKGRGSYLIWVPPQIRPDLKE